MKITVRFRLRTLMVAILIVCLFSAYAAKYYELLRRGAREAESYGLHGFLYVPCEEIFRTHDLTEQRCYALLFAPANWVDQQVFGGQPAITGGIMWSLSG